MPLQPPLKRSFFSSFRVKYNFPTKMSDGFRVCVQFDMGDERDGDKYFVFVNQESFKKVKHVEQHIQAVFKLSQDITLCVKDVHLPRRETVDIIQPGDQLVVKLSKPKVESAACSPSKDAESADLVDEDKSMEMDVVDSKPRLEKRQKKTIVDLLTEELREKSEALQSIPNGTEEDSPVKRKRKRVRRKKNPPQIETPQETILAPIPPIGNGIHVRFSDDEDNNKAAIKQVESNKTNGLQNGKPEANQDEDWKANLLNLAKTRKIKFTRTKPPPESMDVEASPINQNGDNPSEPNHISSQSNKLLSVDLDKCTAANYQELLVDDVIIFKKLRLDESYCPIVSDFLRAKVVNIFKTDNSLEVEIIDGGEQLADPLGKFSLDEDNSEEKDASTIILESTDLLELHLVERLP